jgi:hypothetical protein
LGGGMDSKLSTFEICSHISQRRNRISESKKLSYSGKR